MNPTQELSTIIWQGKEQPVLAVYGYRIYTINDKFIVLADINVGDISYISAANTLDGAVECVIQDITK